MIPTQPIWSMVGPHISFIACAVLLTACAGNTSKQQTLNSAPDFAEVLSDAAMMPSMEKRTHVLLKRIDKRIAPIEVDLWVSAVLEAKRGKPKDARLWPGVRIEPAEYPPFFQVVSSNRPIEAVVVDDDDGHTHYVAVAWGGGRGFYGLLMGLTESAPPKAFGYLLKWRNGTYVWSSTEYSIDKAGR